LKNWPKRSGQPPFRPDLLGQFFNIIASDFEDFFVHVDCKSLQLHVGYFQVVIEDQLINFGKLVPEAPLGALPFFLSLSLVFLAYPAPLPGQG
jgi:hypothetical protein